MTEDLGALIQRVMDEKNWTISTIARRSGLPISTVHSWKNSDRAQGPRGPSPDKLRQLADGLGVTAADVFAAAGRRDPGALDSDEERAFLQLLRQLSSRDRAVLMATGEAMLVRDMRPRPPA